MRQAPLQTTTHVGYYFGGTWASLGVGVSGELNAGVTLFGNADYNIRVDDADGQSFGGRAGVRVKW